MNRRHLTNETLLAFAQKKNIPTNEEQEHLNQCNGCTRLLTSLKDPLSPLQYPPQNREYALGEIYHLSPQKEIHGSHTCNSYIVISGEKQIDPVINIPLYPVMLLHGNVDTPLYHELYTDYTDGLWSRHLISMDEFMIPEAILKQCIGSLGTVTTLSLADTSSISTYQDEHLVTDEAITGDFGALLEERYDQEIAPFIEDLQQRYQAKVELLSTLSKDLPQLSTESNEVAPLLTLIEKQSSYAWNAVNAFVQQKQEEERLIPFAKVAHQTSLTNIEAMIENFGGIGGATDLREVQVLNILVKGERYISTGNRLSYQELQKSLATFRQLETC